MKKIYLSLVVLLTCFFISNVNASDYPYRIDNYDIEVNVLKNDKVKVKETINVFCNEECKGIIKYLPYNDYIIKRDGKKKYYSLKLIDFDSNYEHSITIDKNEYVIKLGDEDKKTGNVTFTNEYTLKIDKSNEFYFNLIESRWSSYISNISFKINFPYSIKEESIYLTTGNRYSTDTSKVNYKIEKNSISGVVNGVLNPYEALTLRLEYNVNMLFNNLKANLLVIVILIVNTVIVYLMWEKFGKDPKVNVKPQNVPFDNLNPLEVSYIANKCQGVNEKMVFSLIIYLANKGYIKIIRDFNKIRLVKLKEYKEENEVERLVMKRLFSSSDEVILNKENKEYKSLVNKVISIMNKDENKSLLTENVSIIIKLIPVILGLINVILTSYIILFDYNFWTFLFTTFFTLIGYTYLSYSATLANNNRQVFFITFSLTLIFISGFNTIFSIITTDITLLAYYILGVLSYSIIMLFIFIMPRRSEWGNGVLEKSLGLKNFLLDPNEEELKMVVKKNKKYFYDIISYSYALDTNEIFVSKYVKAVGQIKNPKWYEDITDK